MLPITKPKPSTAALLYAILIAIRYQYMYNDVEQSTDHAGKGYVLWQG